LLQRAPDSVRKRGLAGTPVSRVEDRALLTGLGRFMDDLGTRPGTLHAAFVRSPHAHAKMLSIDGTKALALAGVHGVVTGEHIKHFTRPFTVGVKAPMEHYALAVGRVRYQGEPVAVVLAESPYLAEDGAALVDAVYEALPPLVDPLAAAAQDAPLLHEKVGSNVVSDRRFRYGDPEAAFASAGHRAEITIRYPRNSVTPIECYGVIAEYESGDDIYEVTSNFQGPFALHPVMALALQVPGARLRLKSPPDSGGSFGVKQGIFPYIVGLCVASRITGRPVKWIEDRLEHLVAATSATNRVTTLKAAYRADGVITAIDWDQLDDCGAYLRAPEPATIYRMHGNMTGAYAIPNLAIRNRIVLTNKTPTGLVRGFGGPQVYFALERLIARIAKQLGRDPIEIMSANFIGADAFPYRSASGGLYDSGDYQSALARLTDDGHVWELRARRDKARSQGRLYGIGTAAVVEPSISNMGYITTVLTAEEREKAGPKGGAVATATVTADPLGAVSVHVASLPQGQGHKTVLAQVVADVFGLCVDDIQVCVELDTGRDAWSVASGNYSSRFAGAVAGTAHLAAMRLRGKLAEIASAQFGRSPDDVVFEDGKAYPQGEPARALPFRRLAATSHWAQATLPQGMEPVLRETVFWSPNVLNAPNAKDEINSSAAHGFVLDLCGVEVERATGRIRIDKYVTVHDAGRLLNPALADGQVRGGFSNALGAALYEHFSYGSDGSFQNGTFADYTVPTAAETPNIEIIHLETPSPITPLGAKGIGEGNCMSTPVCLANAVADALNVDDIELPLTPSRVIALLAGEEPPAPARAAVSVQSAQLSRADFAIKGEGSALVRATPEEVWHVLLDPDALKSVIPGCRTLEVVGPEHYRGQVELGIGLVKGVFAAEVRLFDLDPPRALRLVGSASGGLGASQGEGVVTLSSEDGGTRVNYRYGVDLSGKVAAVGGRMIEGASKVLIGEFFKRLARRAEPPAAKVSLWAKLRALFARFTGGQT
jgi:2-furoyl-CoA dehydrogenase large subunit